jgi:outer membrane receptor for ferrienterochelin and colicin
MNRSFSLLGRVSVLIAVSGIMASAQGTQTASMTGLVVDRSGAPLAGARVEMTSTHLQGKREIVADANGRFVARLLPPGQYHILVSKEGFYTAPLDVHLGLEQVYSPKVVLAPVAMATVEVVGSLPGADKAEMKSAVNYTAEQIDSLPINRGSALDIAYLSPGVTKNANSDKGNIEVRGASGQGNLVLVDGQNVMDNVYTGQRLQIIFDAVEETQVMTGAIPAEYGYIEGGVINQITKVGGNEFSGSLRYDMANPAWNAVNPLNNRAAFANNLSESTSITFGGPIIKDKLWFFGAFYENKPFTVQSFGGTAESGAKITDWVSNRTDMRREIKLTFSPNSDHTITATYNNSSDNYLRDAAGAGEYAVLTPFSLAGNFWGVAYRGILSNNLTLNARMGGKHQQFGNQDNPQDYTQGVQVLANQTSGYTFGAPVWDANDPQPDTRDNSTFNVKLTYFWNALGSQETDFGYDYYQGTTKSSGYQSNGRLTIPGIAGGKPMDWVNLIISDYNQPNHLASIYTDPDSGVPTAGDFQVNTQAYVPDTLKVTTTGLYINDKWTLNSNFIFNIGVRYDSYDAKANAGKIASSSVVSPRLGVKYDVWGDSKLVAGLSYSVLQGRMQETQLQAATYVFHPIAYTFYGNMNNLMPVINNPKNANGIPVQDLLDGVKNGTLIDTTSGNYGVTNAVVGTKFDPNLKPPKVTEWQASLAYNFTSDMFGSGFVRATAVNKKWSNIVDVVVGRYGQKDDGFGNTLDVNYWTNQPLARRDYKSLELDGQTKIGKWQFQANVTWSDLQGNGTGEGKSTPANPYGIEVYNYAATGGSTKQYDINYTAPYGRLATLGSPAPLSINGIVGYTTENSYGKITYGATYRFSSGAHYDESRTFDLSAVPGLSNDPNVGGFASNVIGTAEYRNGQRGTGVFNGQSFTDLSIQQDFKVLKVLKKEVNAFLKVTFYNVWNHQQLVSWNTSFKANESGIVGPGGPAWQHSSASFGSPTTGANFGAARSLAVSAGFKF